VVADEENYTRAKRGDLEAMARSIASEGIRVPLRCHKKGGEYVLTAGFRRMSAIALINENPGEYGIAEPIDRVPVLMESRHSNDADRTLWQMLDNAHRCDASPMEEAKVMRKLIDIHGVTADASQGRATDTPRRGDGQGGPDGRSGHREASRG
jgi:hypothetical protein